MLSEEWKTISDFRFPIFNRHSAIANRKYIFGPALRERPFHFGLLMVWAFSCLLAMYNTGCKHSEPSSAPRYPVISDEPDDLAQATLWETYMDEGREAYSDGRYEEAEQLFKAAMREAEKFGPENYRLGQSLYWLGAVVLDLGRPNQAKSLLERALGIIEKLSGDETTLPSRQIAMADILERLSEIETKQKNYSLAKALANKAAEIGRKLENKRLLDVTLKNLALIHAYSGDYDSAIETFSELILLDPDNAKYYYNRALICKHNGDYESAIADLTKVSELQPDDPQPINELAWTLSTCEVDEIRNGHRAVELAQKAVEFSKHKNPQYLDTLAAAYAETGQFDMAVRTQQEAISLLTNPEEIEVYLTRLRLYVDRKPYRVSNKKTQNPRLPSTKE